MKHAKRMVLVPEDMAEKYEQRQRLRTSPIMASMMGQDTMLNDILKQTDMSDAQRQKVFNANLERYLELRQQKESEIPTVRIARKETSEPEVVNELSDELILGNIPKTMRGRASMLLDRLKTRPDVVSWDNTGQVVVDGKTIPQSNITDLISDAMRARKNFNPKGHKEFFRAMAKINMPKDVARNEERWKDITTPPVTPENVYSRYLERTSGARKELKTPKTWHNY